MGTESHIESNFLKKWKTNTTKNKKKWNAEIRKQTTNRDNQIEDA